MFSRPAANRSRMAECTYCGSDLTAYDPVHVAETVEGRREPAGSFCNYACLVAHVEERGLATDAACEWSPD